MKRFLLLFFVMIPQVCFGVDYLVPAALGPAITSVPGKVDRKVVQRSESDSTSHVNREVGKYNSRSGEDVVTSLLKKQIKEHVSAMQSVYEKLKTCTVAQSQYLQILGMENDLCHIKYVDFDCFIPLDVAQDFAELGIESAERMFEDRVPFRSEADIEMQEILTNENYCSNKVLENLAVENENEVSE